MTCMSRSRTRVDVAVRRSFGFAHILACQSVGLESQRDMGSFLVHGRGARVHGNLQI
jgi:3'-phosphoadenosine 5'-phosphosulfate sulfotransferase